VYAESGIPLPVGNAWLSIQSQAACQMEEEEDEISTAAV